MVSSAPYERDMRIIYDVLTKSVLVSFRDTTKLLGPFPDKKTAVDAAED